MLPRLVINITDTDGGLLDRFIIEPAHDGQKDILIGRLIRTQAQFSDDVREYLGRRYNTSDK